MFALLLILGLLRTNCGKGEGRVKLSQNGAKLSQNLTKKSKTESAPHESLAAATLKIRHIYFRRTFSHKIIVPYFFVTFQPKLALFWMEVKTPTNRIKST